MGMANCNLILVFTFADEVGGGVVSGVAIPLSVGLLRSTSCGQEDLCGRKLYLFWCVVPLSLNASHAYSVFE